MVTLAEALHGMPTDRLRALATVREVDPQRLATVKDKRQLAQLLAGEISAPPSVARAVLLCDARQLRLLQLLFSLEARHAVSWRSVLDAAGGAGLDEALGAIFSGLEDLGLAVRTGDRVLLLEAARHQVPTSLSDRYTVAGCLHTYDAPSLRRIGDRLGLGDGTKQANIDRISQQLLQMDGALLDNLAPGREERAVLEYLIQQGGAATAIEVAGAVLTSTDDFFRYDWQNRWKMGKERNAIDRLLAAGMIYVVSYAYGFNLFLVLPGDLLRVLTGEARSAFWTAPVPEPAVLTDPPSTVTKRTGLIRDIVGLFGFVSTQEAARTSTGYIHKSSLKNLTRTLSFPDERYAAFLYAICRQAGLIAPLSEKQHYGVTDAGRDWLRQGPLDQVRSLFLAWREGDFWGEMYSDPLKRANEYRQRQAIVAVREAAIGLLAIETSERFVDIESLTDTLSFRCPLLLAQSTHLGGDLVASPANFMRLLIAECLYWLGLVELGWNAATSNGAVTAMRDSRAVDTPTADTALRNVVPKAFRLTAEGTYLLNVPGALAPELPPTENQFILQANSEIFLPPYLEPGTLYLLLLITEMPGKAPSGNIVSLTRESIRRALDLGISGKEIMEFLRTHARMGVPQNVEYLVNEVSEKHGHIRIGRAQMYIQVDSPMVLKELQARRELKGYFVRTLGDTVAILNAAEPEKLLKELRKAGYLPTSDDMPQGTAFRFQNNSGSSARTTRDPQSSMSEKRKADVIAALDWDRIARDDAQPYRESAAKALPETRPGDAVQDKGNIRLVLQEAIQSSTRVQVAYQGQSDAATMARAIEPHRVMGNFVVAYLPLEGETVTLNINRISWARATDEPFAPPL